MRILLYESYQLSALAASSLNPCLELLVLPQLATVNHSFVSVVRIEKKGCFTEADRCKKIRGA
jgi:hypothetical protein